MTSSRPSGDGAFSVVHEVLEVSHGWVAFISDLEGNVLQIYQAREGSD